MTATGFIYAIAAPGSDRVKIGFASNPRRRLSELRCASHEDLHILGAQPGGRGDEANFHEKFSALRVAREWFWLRGELEAFVATLPPLPPLRRVALKVEAPRGPFAPGPTWQLMIDRLREIEGTIVTSLGLTRSQISFEAVRDRAFISKVLGGKSFNVRTFDRVVQWFSENWPDDVEWPADVPRPARTPETCAP